VPIGPDPDTHQGAGHPDREAGQGAGGGPGQHEDSPAGGGHAPASTAPPPQEHHQGASSTTIGSLDLCSMFGSALRHWYILIYNGSPSLQIAIATPGRLLEILKQKAVQLDKVKVVVVDEVRALPSAISITCLWPHLSITYLRTYLR